MTKRMPAVSTARQHMSQKWLTIFGVLLAAGCGNDPAVHTIDVLLSPGQIYEFPTVGGDEESARIVTQARHFAISEVRRDAATNWVAVYVYQPQAGYSGSDGAELEVRAGSDGASSPTRVWKLVFRFSIAP